MKRPDTIFTLVIIGAPMIRAFPSWIIAFLSIILLNACSSTNSSRIHNPGSLASIQRVGLAPIGVSESDSKRYDKAERLVTLALIRSLESNTSLQVEDPDSMLRFLSVKRGLPDNAILAVAKKLGFDAVLFCNLQLVEDAVPGMDWTNAEIDLRLVNTSESSLVLESRYNTLRGNSYIQAPRIQQVLVDAVKGAIQPVVSAVKGG